jgi:hypothetical protein
MPDEPEDEESGEAGAELADALIALRRSLIRVQEDGAGNSIRFRIDHVELTVQLSVTKTRKGSAGVKWRVLSLGGERSREQQGVQTLSLRLSPVLFNDDRRLPDDGQYISGAEVEGER